MRRLNAVLTACIMVLFLFHAVMGAFQLLGTGSNTVRVLGWVTLVLTALHALIGIKLTADTLRTQKQAGASYPKENRLFWARRISGFILIALIALHVGAFSSSASGAYRLLPFGRFKLAVQLLLVLTLALHVLSNVKPMLISFGIRRFEERSGDILFVLALLLLFMTAALVFYYFRWNAF